MMGPFDGWGFFGWLWMLIPLLFWGGLLAVIVWAVARIFPNRPSSGGPPERHTDPAEDALRARFARGEIDAAEYEDSMRVLRGGTKDGNVGMGTR
ncbi:MAG TPA: hypothetical protein VK869_02025 [Rubrobacteraceae bacterium]|nr:hypothetical protein [Rubrobacteraceae bacterium]